MFSAIVQLVIIGLGKGGVAVFAQDGGLPKKLIPPPEGAEFWAITQLVILDMS